MAYTKKTEVRKETINRLKQRIGLDLAKMYVNYGMTIDVCDKLMEHMGWTATECLEWEEQQEMERGKKPRRPLSPKAARKSEPSMAGVKKPTCKRPGVLAFKEIRRFQKSTKLLLKFLAFARLVRNLVRYQIQPTFSM